MSWCAGLAGLHSGPIKLNTVRNGRLRLTAASRARPGWYLGANKKASETSARQRRDTSGSGSNATPSAASTSVLPARLVAARFPCFTTGALHAAATMAAAVEMLIVPAPSPPVPHVSRRRSLAIPQSQAFIRSRTARTVPSSSAAVTPFSRQAVRNAVANSSSPSPSSSDPTASCVSRAQSAVFALSRSRARVRAVIKAPGRCVVPSCPGSSGQAP